MLNPVVCAPFSLLLAGCAHGKLLWSGGMYARVESLLAVYPPVSIDWSLALAVVGFSAPGGEIAWSSHCPPWKKSLP
jgi:hypothetical protein